MKGDKMKQAMMVMLLTIAGAAWGQTSQWAIVTVHTNTGQVKPGMFSVMRVSPLGMLETNEYTVSLSGSAYWTNGVISMFQPVLSPGTNVGVVTVTILTENQRIRQLRYSATGSGYAVRPAIAEDGQSIVLRGRMMQNPPVPGATMTNECYLDGLAVEVFESAKMVGATNDLRGLYTLFPHPANGAEQKTNITDFYTVTKGWYDAVVQDAVALWARHPSTVPAVMRAGSVFDDGISTQQRFRWTYQPNGYLALTHESDTTCPVMAFEALDPFPWIVTQVTGPVATLQFTTNGIAGVFRLQTCSNMSTNGAVPEWVNTMPISTNPAPAGYLSITASNTLGAGTAFWRVSVSNAVQETARAKFCVPVQAPRFELGAEQWLYWSNNALRIRSGTSNGTVNVTW